MHRQRDTRAQKASQAQAQAAQFSIYWVRFFIRWHAPEGAMRHSCEIYAAEVKAFLAIFSAEHHKIFPRPNVLSGKARVFIHFLLVHIGQRRPQAVP